MQAWEDFLVHGDDAKILKLDRKYENIGRYEEVYDSARRADYVGEAIENINMSL